MTQILEEQLGHGAVRDPHDPRDIHLHDIAGAPTPFDWNKGFDIEKQLGITIPVKNQMSSESCVGQGWSYLMAVKNAQITGIYDEVSAKAIYSQIFLKPNGGANIRDGGLLLQNWGAVLEKIVNSHKTDGSVDEQFMEDTSWITPEIVVMAKNLMALSIADVPTDIESWACAIRDNGGIVFGVDGTNNGTWNSLEPQPPIGSPAWGHCLFGGKALTDNNSKSIKSPNSWGNLGGWQNFRQNWFDNTQYLFTAWTLIEKINKPKNMAYIIKDANSASVGIWTPAANEIDFISMCAKNGINIPQNPNGSVNWAKVNIQGKLTLNK